MYDLCVIGAGLIGSAAARHASLQRNTRVCLIGPEEPEERSLDSPREIFGSHYDEGRITRRSDPDPVWATLAQRSIERYRELETSSGIEFYTEAGCLMVGTAQEQFLSRTRDTVITQDIQHEYLDSELLRKRFPFLRMSDTDQAVYEKNQAGHISPRLLIKAQKKVAINNKCDVINDVVCKVSREYVGDKSYMLVLTEEGRRIEANRVLLATGSFTTFKDLLSTGTDPDVEICPLTVAKVEVSEEDAKRVEQMPSILYYGYGAPEWPANYPHNSSNAIGVYVLPPIKYPDGKIYIKLGNFHDSISERLTTPAEVKAWFCTDEVTSQVTESARLITSMVKGIKAKSYHGDNCVILMTPTGRPYIDLVYPGLGVAIGGNGYAAKSSDEIGRIAAMLMLRGEWDSDLQAKAFKLRLKPRHKTKSNI